jgi:hypothetical protein
MMADELDVSKEAVRKISGQDRGMRKQRGSCRDTRRRKKRTDVSLYSWTQRNLKILHWIVSSSAMKCRVAGMIPTPNASPRSGY